MGSNQAWRLAEKIYSLIAILPEQFKYGVPTLFIVPPEAFRVVYQYRSTAGT